MKWPSLSRCLLSITAALCTVACHRESTQTLTSQGEEERSASVASGPSCAESACYLAVRRANAQASFEEVQTRLNLSNGDASETSLLAIKKTLEAFGLHPRAVKSPAAEVIKHSGGAIVHLRLENGLEHFAYLRIANMVAVSFDPYLTGGSPQVVPMTELERRMTGFAILLPNE